MISIAFFVNVICTLLMVGAVWFMQAVHYPMFRYIGAENFPAYYKSHRLKMIVYTFPLMSLEVFTAFLSLIVLANVKELTPEIERSMTIYGISIMLLILIHVLTFQAIRPVMKRLSTAFSEKDVLLLTNWNLARAILWTLRALFLLSAMVS